MERIHQIVVGPAADSALIARIGRRESGTQVQPSSDVLDRIARGQSCG